MNTNKHQAKLAYHLISNRANANTIVQGLTGLLGFPFNLVVDGAVIPTIYGPMLNALRGLYGHPGTPDGTVATLVPQILPEVFTDMVLDKVLGSIPIAGSYFNAICAKTFTWRLGILFAMLSSRGPEIPKSAIAEAMVLIRKCFPQSGMFTFTTPDESTFISLVTRVTDVSETEFQRKVSSALAAMQ